MQLADAYRVLGLAPGAPEPDVRSAHEHHQLQWHGDRHNQNPQASQYAYARRAELAVALDMIHRAGFPDASGAPRMGSYGAAPAPAPYVPQPPAAAPYPPPYPPPAAPPVYGAPQGVEIPWQPHHGPLPMPSVAPPSQAMVDAQRAQKRSEAVTKMLVGGGLIILGVVITAATHDAAVRSGGGTYVVAYGPIVFGVIRFFQGLFGIMAA
jgi:hypothetical protein